MQTARVLVTGGAGFIGSHLARRLLDEGHAVRIIDNFATGYRHNLDDVADRVTIVEGDIRDPKQCADAVSGVSVVFHVAALPSVPRSMADPIGTHDVNVNGTLNLLEAARHAGVSRFVYSGSSSAYGDTAALPKVEGAEPLPRSPYAAAKLAGELYTLAYARAGLMDGVALRYFNVFGPRQDPNGPYSAVIPMLFRAVITESPVTIFGDGGQTRDFTYVDNVVDANLLAATASASQVSGQAMNVGAGSRTSLLELISMVERVTGHAMTIRHAAERPGDVRDSQASLERANAMIGYTPRVSVREGLEKLWTWYLANPSVVMAAAPG